MQGPLLLILAMLLPQAATPEREARGRLPVRGPGDGVWIVDSSGGGQLTELQAAVDAAAPGDLIVIRDNALGPSARYRLTGTHGKALRLVGDEGGAPWVEIDPLQDLVAGGTMVLRNMRVYGEIAFARIPSVVWLEDVHETPRVLLPLFVPPALDVDQVASGVVVRSSFQTGVAFATLAADGVRVRDGELYLFESTVVGGTGPFCVPFSDANGGDGLVAEGATWLAFATSLAGGDAGSYLVSPSGPICSPASKGLSYAGVGSLGFAVQSLFPDGTSAPVTTLLGQTRTLQAPALVQDGSPAVVTVTGQPGDPVSTLVSPMAEVDFEVSLYAPLLTGPQASVAFQGFLPPSGTLTFELELPPLVGERGFQGWVIQSVQLEGGSVPYLSSGSLVHVVRPGVIQP